MALFFRGETRKFFLILRGTARGEKKRAGFGSELREFSRGVDRCGSNGSAAGGRRRYRSRLRNIGPMPGTAALETRATRVSAVAGQCPHHGKAQHCESFGQRDVHKAAQPGRLGRALTVRTHSVSSGVDARISAREWPRSLIGTRRSPLKTTAPRVIWVWTSPSATSRIPVHFIGEHRHAIRAGPGVTRGRPTPTPLELLCISMVSVGARSKRGLQPRVDARFPTPLESLCVSTVSVGARSKWGPSRARMLDSRHHSNRCAFRR
ncbi:hypothetical protein BLA24064_05082 [Burkholderia latens]|uniref:Uncharacterized protein n=1 Tax=Burkholderia latens TaxID=488446 RepID=A0A6P2PHQ0_9BURK|nr:hypothetical protein BLA24064_05082 [Burkholderia latens]